MSQLTDTFVVFLHYRLRNHGANVASLGDILVESKLHHQLVQDAGDDSHGDVLVGGNLGETIARHRGNDEVVRQRRRVRGVLLLDLVQDGQELEERA